MAEGLLRHALGDSTNIEVLSAGVAAADGQGPSGNAITALERVGIDITQQRSRMLTPMLVEEADYIFGMTSGHVETIRRLFPEAMDKTHLVRGFNDNLSPMEKEISDPIGSSLEIYEQCRDEIVEGINQIIKVITQEEPSTSAQSSTVKIALGSDHAGYELKESLKQQLTTAGRTVQDAGTDSLDSTDYPDYAQAVVREVQEGNADFGILVCSTGIGMSISANKALGIRAALVHDKQTARLSREHNNANILCLASSSTSAATAQEIVDLFLTTEFTGGRHERRLNKISDAEKDGGNLASTDPDIFKIVGQERTRQQDHLELIASENFTSPAVMEAQGSVLTNKYAEGYPGKRWYGGCEFVDEAERLAIQRAKDLFGAEHANVQPHSGSGANMAVYFSTLQPGDKILTMDLSHGGHLTHGNKANFSGRFFEVTHYGVDKETERIDYDNLEAMAKEHRPKMITVGASAYPRVIDFERMAAIAKSVDALLLADIAHIAGLVATGNHPSPVGHADFVTTTTHKTLRGPRGGLILCGEQYAKAIDSQTFPGIQGGPLMHVIAAKAVCFKEALSPDFATYQKQVVTNAAALAARLSSHDYRLVSGGTENHLMLVDVGQRDLTGKACQLALDEAGITVNKNTIPFETRSPFQASGIRIGSPAVTTRGMKEPEMELIADLIAEVLQDVKNLDVAKKVRERVKELTARYPLPY